MKRSHKSGLGFGVTSGIITTLGLMVGLYSGTHSSLVIIGGVLTIAIADTFADSLGMHVAKETINEYSTKEVWEATISTFITKFLVAMSFVIPLLLFRLSIAILVSIIWGILLLSTFSFYVARTRKEKELPIVIKHLSIAIVVIITTYYLQGLIEIWFY